MLLNSSQLPQSYCQCVIKEAVWSYEPNKAPGYDDFKIGFIKKIWSQQVILSLYLYSHFFSLVNSLHLSILVSIIPKIQQPFRIEDFRPISVVGSLCKIISKVIANRLEHVIGKVINDNQIGFIKDRYIFDVIHTSSESVQWLKKKNNKGYY